MKKYNIPLKNGYQIVITIGLNSSRPNEIRIDTYDSDDVWNQELIRISNYNSSNKYDEEHFNIQVTENESTIHDFIINLHHDLELNDKEEENNNTEKDFQPLVYKSKGEEVKKVQKRLKELGYFDGTIGGNYLTKTQSAVKDFQLNNGLEVNGNCDEVTYNKLFSEDIKKKEIKVTEGSSTEPAHGTAKKMDWWTSDIQKIFAKGVTATITDVATGIAWREQRRGGTNHADLQPCTAEDTAAFKKACKKWSWERRAVFVTINGINYAASINCQPHGGSSIKNNNFDGHHCCHFTNSRTHCSDKVCPQHKKAIEKAAKAILP